MARIYLFLILLFIFHPGIVIGSDEKPLSDDAFVRLLAARNAAKAGDQNKAIQRYRDVISRHPELWAAHLELGQLLLNRGELEEGAHHIKVVADEHPDDRTTQLQLIDVLLLNRQFQQAHPKIETWVTRAPLDEQVQLRLARHYSLRRRYPQAQRLFETLLKSTVDKESRLGLLDVHLARGDLDHAEQVLRDLIHDFPYDPYVHKHQILVRGRQGRIVEAFRGLSNIHDAYLREVTEAELLTLTGQYFAAEHRFKELLTRYPRDYAARIGLGYAHLGQDDEIRAAHTFQTVLDQYPEDVAARLILAEVLFRQREWKHGMHYVSQVLKEEPDVLEAVYLNHYFKQRDHSNALGQPESWLFDSVKTPGEALGVQNHMTRLEDVSGIRKIAVPYIQHAPPSRLLVKNWVNATAQLGAMHEALEQLHPVQERYPNDEALGTAVATLRFHQRASDKAKQVLQNLSPTVDTGNLYRKLDHPIQASNVFSDIINQDPFNTPAHVGHIAALADNGNNEQTARLLTEVFDSCPQSGWSALARLFVNAERTSLSYKDLVRAEMERRQIDDKTGALDSRMSYLGLLTQYEPAKETVTAYETLMTEHPDRPLIQLGLARALAQQHKSRGLHHIQPVIDAYNTYLASKPYDVAVWTEKARFLGWNAEYDDALHEYKTILTRYPQEEVVQVEMAAKKQMWREHNRSALRLYENAVEIQPRNEEVLGDMGNISSAHYRFVDSQRTYQRLLAINPNHHHISESLELARIFHRPQVTGGIGYVKMDGFDGSILTKYMPVTGEVFAPLSEDFWGGLGYQWVHFDQSGPPSSANIARVMGRYSPSSFWHIDGYVSGLAYSGTGKSNINFGAGLSYEWLSGVKGRVETGRQDLWQNAETIRRNISFHTYAIGAEYHFSRTLALQAGAGYWDYSDDNWNINGQLSGTYTLLPFPHPLKLSYQLDTFGFDKRSVYFSPDFFAKNTFAIGWQHFLGFPHRKEHHGESPMRNRYSGLDIYNYLGWPTRPNYLPKTALNTYSLDYGISLDNNSNVYHQLSASFAYSITRRCHFQVSGLIIRADVVDQDALNGMFQCHL